MLTINLPFDESRFRLISVSNRRKNLTEPFDTGPTNWIVCLAVRFGPVLDNWGQPIGGISAYTKSFEADTPEEATLACVEYLEVEIAKRMQFTAERTHAEYWASLPSSAKSLGPATTKVTAKDKAQAEDLLKDLGL